MRLNLKKKRFLVEEFVLVTFHLLLKELSSEIAHILIIIYNFSIKKSNITNDCRTSNVTPAYKIDQKYIPTNFWPLSLLNI